MSGCTQCEASLVRCCLFLLRAGTCPGGAWIGVRSGVRVAPVRRLIDQLARDEEEAKRIRVRVLPAEAETVGGSIA